MSKNQFILLTISWCIINFQTAFSQQVKGSITGIEDLSSTIVRLNTTRDSTLVKATFADSLGQFELDALKPGSYFISIESSEALPFSSDSFQIDDASTRISLPVFQLTKRNTAIDEVAIVATKPFIERKIDRVVVNPDAMIGNAGTTALDILEKAPGVMVDVDGNISLKGKPGVQIYIDNKPTYLPQAELAGYLRSLPSSSVGTIEIMTNPPARYEAAGNAGIINIQMKRLKEKGFNGGINLSYGQGRHSRTNNSFNLNYRVNKINLFTSIGISQNNSFQDLTINRYYFTPSGQASSSFLQHSDITRKHGGNSAKIGLDWYASKKSTLGFVLTGFYNPSTEENVNNAQILDGNDVLIRRVNANSLSDNKWINGGANINYSLKIDSLGKELSFNADYIHYTSDHIQTLRNQTDSVDGSFVSALNLYSTLPATIAIQTAKADYVHSLKNNNRFDAGLKTAFVQTNNTASFFDVVNDVNIPNYTFSNEFRYRENTNAAYINYSQDWNRFSLQLGLRFESIVMKGNQLGNPMVQDSSFTRTYNSLFPTAFLLYSLDTAKFHQLIFSFGRRIDYPNYEDLNPFTYPMDAYTYYAGNPYIKPTFSYNFELTYSFKNKISITADYSYVNNLIQETNEQVNNIYYSRPGNFGQQQVAGISISGEQKLAKWLNMNFYSECKNIAFNTSIYGQPLKEQRWYWYIGPTFQFFIHPKLTAELAGSYQTRILVGQFLTIPVGSIRAGLAYKILKEKGSLKLNLSDILYTNQPGGDIRNIANSKANWLSKLDTRVVTLSFSYRFNKGKSMNARQSGAADSEKKRVNTN
jgi:hypothetical protein